MARRTFMRAFSAQAGMSFGRWRQQAWLFAALEMLAQSKSVTEVAIAVGYDSVSAFIEMFRTMLGTTSQTYFRGRYSWAGDRAVAATARLPLTLSRYRHACSASSASAKSLHTRDGDKNVFAAQNESDESQSLIAAQCFLE